MEVIDKRVKKGSAKKEHKSSRASKISSEKHCSKKLKCKNCLKKIHTSVVKSFSSWKETDNKLSCPFCLSLKLEAVK